VARTQNVEVALYDMLGRQVATLFNGTLAAGAQREFTIDGTNLSSGTYVYRVVGENFSQTRRVTLLK
jgi:hypothetical protein